MGKKSLLALAVLSIVLSFGGCQSEPQNMGKGLANEYQGRYGACVSSVERFSRYAGFGFVEEKGVCKCNESVCSGNETCNVHGKCEKIEPEPECIDGQKICISPTIGQVCIGEHWSEPINCVDNKVCNTQLQDEGQICDQKCSVGYCKIENDGLAYFTKCEGGKYVKKSPCNETGNVSCTIAADNTSNCGKCINGYVQCSANGKMAVAKCVNGQMIKYNKECVQCKDNMCYSDPICVTDNNESRVIITAEYGTPEELTIKTCSGGCNPCRKGCSDDLDSCVLTNDSCKTQERCDGQYAYVCEDGVPKQYECSNGCDSNINRCNPVPCMPACQDDEKCVDGACKCNASVPKCKDNKVLKTCDSDGNWKEVRCDDGEYCDETAGACKCQSGATRCNEEGEIACINGSWSEPKSCDGLGCADNTRCNTSSEPQCAQVCQDDEECIDGTCKCKSNATRCDNDEKIECIDGSWGTPVSCNGLGCTEDQKRCNTAPEEEQCEYIDYTCSDKHLIQCTTKDGLKDVDSNFDDVGDYEFQNCIKNSNGKYYCAFSNDTGMTNKHCCESGTDYCFDKKAYHCTDGKFELNTDCDCSNRENGERESCTSGKEPGCLYYFKCSNDGNVQKCRDKQRVNCEDVNDNVFRYEVESGGVNIYGYCSDDEIMSCVGTGLQGLIDEIVRIINIHGCGYQYYPRTNSKCSGRLEDGFYYFIDANQNETGKAVMLYIEFDATQSIYQFEGT